MTINPLKVLLLCLIALPVQAKWHKDSQPIMGTNILVEVWSEDEQRGQQAVQTVMAEMERINQLMSPYLETSELSKVNRAAATQAVEVTEELFELLQLSVGLSQDTFGAFDITYASVGFLYDYRQQQKPSEQQVADKLAAINYQHLKLDSQNRSVRFSHPDVKIDLGGIAKGHAVDNALALLRNLRIEHALVTAGGDTGLLGDRRGRDWMVGIRDPRNRDRQAVVLPLRDTAMSTSGDYERYFEQDGVRYHHILSPKTGQSASEVQSVTILGPRSTLNDALSTAVFVLGLQNGMDLINRTPGYEAIIMDNQRLLHASTGLSSVVPTL